jgi:hypothetical protein
MDKDQLIFVLCVLYQYHELLMIDTMNNVDEIEECNVAIMDTLGELNALRSTDEW